MFFIIEVKSQFTDKETGHVLKFGDKLITRDKTRVKDIIRRGLGRLSRIETKKNPKKKRNEIIIFHDSLASIGGIETWIYNLAKTFSNRKIECIFQKVDLDQAIRLGEFCDVQIDDGREIEADVVIVASYNAFPLIKGRVKARKIYQMCHADWSELKKVSVAFKNYEWNIDSQIDKVIAVSETAQKSLKTAFKKPIDSVVVRNLPPRPKEDCKIFLTLSRLTSEKGGKRILQMIERFHKENRNFLWLIASNFSGEIENQLKDDSSVIFLGANINRANLLNRVDYLVQLSDNESYCYSAHEALAVGTPVIGTRIPALKEIIRNGENGFLVDLDLSDLDTNAIFKKKFKIPNLDEPVDPNWEKLLNGEF